MRKQQRFRFVIFILLCLSAAVGIALYALQDNIALFYTPHEIEAFQAQNSPAVRADHVFRLGGLVKEGSLERRGDDLTIAFVVTDDIADIRVEYTGIVPDLFKEGQGVVAKGALNDKGVFAAHELLAKHDEKYMPPELVKSLEKAAKEKRNRTAP